MEGACCRMPGKRGPPPKSNLSGCMFTKKTVKDKGVTVCKYQCILCGKFLVCRDSMGNLIAHFKICSGNDETGFDQLKEVDPKETFAWNECGYFCAPGKTRPREELQEILEYFRPAWEELKKDPCFPGQKKEKKTKEVKDAEEVAEDKCSDSKSMEVLTEKVEHLSNGMESMQKGMESIKKRIIHVNSRSRQADIENKMLKKQLKATVDTDNALPLETEEEPHSALQSRANSRPRSKETSAEPALAFQ